MTFGDKRDSLKIISPHAGSISMSESAWGPGNKEMKIDKFNTETRSSVMFFWNKREFSEVDVDCMKTYTLENNWFLFFSQ